MCWGGKGTWNPTGLRLPRFCHGWLLEPQATCEHLGASVPCSANWGGCAPQGGVRHPACAHRNGQLKHELKQELKPDYPHSDTVQCRRGTPKLADYLWTVHEALLHFRATQQLFVCRCKEDTLRSPKGRHGDLRAETAIRHSQGPLPEDLGKEQMIKAQGGS